MNSPFPLEYPAIAPFYSNVDTTVSNKTTSISYFESSNTDLLHSVTTLVRDKFTEEFEFVAVSVFVATWENVGHYREKNDEQNTFQVSEKFYILYDLMYN